MPKATQLVEELEFCTTRFASTLGERELEATECFEQAIGWVYPAFWAVGKWPREYERESQSLVLPSPSTAYPL